MIDEETGYKIIGGLLLLVALIWGFSAMMARAQTLYFPPADETQWIAFDYETVIEIESSSPVTFQRCVATVCGAPFKITQLPFEISPQTAGGPAGGGKLYGIQAARPYDVTYEGGDGVVGKVRVK